MKTKNFARATHGKVTRYYSDVVKLEDILFPYIHNKVEKIANEKYSKFNYN